MRTLRLSLTGTVILALLGGLGGAVVAQPEEGQERPQPPTRIKGTVPCGTNPHPQSTEWTLVGPMGDGNLVRVDKRGLKLLLGEPQLNDSRFGGQHAFYSDETTFTGPGLNPEFPILTSQAWRAEDEEGAWQGFGHGFWGAEYDRPTSTLVLAGEGAYEGLSAIWHLQFSLDPCRFRIDGIVFEGEMLPVPKPDQPPAD